MKNIFTTKNITFLALFTAIIMISTMYIYIPNGMGYTNFGDSFIFLGAMLFGPVFALISGGIGSMLADIALGYTAYAPFTLIIKGLEGLLAGIIAKAFIKTKINKNLAIILAMLIGAVEMITGYYFTNSFLSKSLLSGFGSVPTDILQGVISVVIGYLLTYSLSKIKIINKYTNNLLNNKEKKDEKQEDN